MLTIVNVAVPFLRRTDEGFHEKLGWTRIVGAEPVGTMRKALPQ